MKPAISSLETIPFLRHITQKDWHRFQELATALTYRPGNILFYQGNSPLGLHFIAGGRVKLFKEDRLGRCQIVRIVHGPDLLGDRAFFSEMPYACTAEVMEEAEISFLKPAHFWEIFGKNQDTHRLLAQRFAVELGRAEDYMHCLSACTINTRMATQLLASAKQTKSGQWPKGEFILSVSRSELAQIVGTTPEGVSRTLANFCVKNVISVSGRHVRILNEDRLRLAACTHDLVY